MKKVKYDIISPDGFAIHPFNTYLTPEKAWEAFKEWKMAYKRQGYYSSVKYGRIPLIELKNYCELVTI